mgnify:CR=1 FL=1
MTGNMMVVYDIYSNNDDVAEVTTNDLSNNDQKSCFTKFTKVEVESKISYYKKNLPRNGRFSEKNETRQRVSIETSRGRR